MEHLRFDNLNEYLLLKNGNYLYKVPFRGGYAVIKLYYGSRSWFRRVYKTFDNVVMCGQTSFMPKARLRTEQDAMRVWREAGIRVFDIYRDVVVEGLPEGGYALYEYVKGRNLHKLLPDESVPIEERLAVYRKFLEQWRRRHELAVANREPRLIHENGDLKHVMACADGELVWFDFEMCFRSSAHVEDLVAREILAYLKSLNFVKGERFEQFFTETMAHYGNRDFLAHVYPVAFQNRNPLVRWARRLDYRFRNRSRKPHSKYNMAKKVKAYLEEHAP
ncbi:MAG: hypothetical protein JXR37_25075 [Kiritimatiellae bacterium]|nr:hypothetical protein [Kiritimatiellia bacterium]